MYYWIQIQIHRPFLREKSGFSSVAICVTAARSCSHIIHVYDTDLGTLPVAMLPAVVYSSVVLLMNAKNGLASPRDMSDVRLSMQALGRQEDQLKVAGRYQYVLFFPCQY